MYTNWAPDLLAMAFSDRVLDPGGLDPDAAHEQARFWIKVVTRIVFVAYLGWELVRLWRMAGQRERSLVEPILEASARAFVVLILLVLTWVLEWYWMWPLALVTLLGWRSMLTKVVVGYTLTSLPIFYVHHYWSTYMPSELVLVYALPPLALPLVAPDVSPPDQAHPTGIVGQSCPSDGSGHGMIPEGSEAADLLKAEHKPPDQLDRARRPRLWRKLASS